MLDQSFSIENFRRILDYENRKGVYLEGIFFPRIKDVSELVKRLNVNLKNSRYQTEPELLTDYRKRLRLEIEAAEELKDSLLVDEFTQIRDKLLSGKFKFILAKNEQFSDKPIYTTSKSPEIFFALKQIQFNFRKLYKVKQANRFSILSHLKSLLDDGFPKYVIRTDIESFYESIPHEKLLQKLNEENLLTFSSKKIIFQILSEYKRLSGSNVGLPRGIGISAYLAELYMRDIDQAIKSLPTVSYYARYVDDIVIIFTPFSGNDGMDYLEDIKEIIETKHGLVLNEPKTKLIDLTNSPSNKNMEYLGYKIGFGAGEITFKLSSRKIDRYKFRITATINSYINFARVNEKLARKLLVKRIRFLTGNTRLSNNKKNILVGVYYSNNLLPSSTNFNDLDAFLQHETSRITNQIIRNRLAQYSFVEGFRTKRFSPFSTTELSNIFQIWRDIK
jgi:hypothetical protein